MKAPILPRVGLVVILLLVPLLAYAQTYFEPCFSALAKPSFKALASYLSASNLADEVANEQNAGKCFQLNDHEFLVLPRPSGVIYHCAAKEAKGCALYEEKDGFRWDSPEVFKEFTAAAGKHFVLLKQVTLSHGVYSESYHTLYLLPPSQETDGLPFTIQPLIGVSMNNDSGSLADDPCGWSEDLDSVPASAEKIDSVAFGNDQLGKATVTVRMTQVDCDTNQMTHYRRAYRFAGSQFVESFNNLPAPEMSRFVGADGLAVDRQGDAFISVSRPGRRAILRIGHGGRPAVLSEGAEGFADGASGSAKFEMMQFLAIPPNGSVLVSDGRNGAIRRVSQAGLVSTMPGGNMPLPNGKDIMSDRRGLIGSPEGIAVDRGGTIYVACDEHSIRKISPAGAVTMLAGGQQGYADGAGEQAKFSNIDSIAVGSAGEVYVSDLANHAIRKIMPNGSVSTLISGNKELSVYDIPDDEFYWARGLAAAPDGGVYASSGNAVFKISASGVARVYAGGSTGFADGAAAAAHFKAPSSLAVDGAGNLFVLDKGNEAVREIRIDGRVSTVIARKRVRSGSTCCQVNTK